MPSKPKPARQPQISQIPITQLVRSPFNQRTEYHGVDELAQSIEAQGLLHPIVCRPLAGGYYEIVAGHRRWKAAGYLGLKEVPVIVRGMSDDDAREVIVTENLQREGLTPLEEAWGVANLLERGRTVDEVGRRRLERSTRLA